MKGGSGYWRETGGAADAGSHVTSTKKEDACTGRNQLTKHKTTGGSGVTSKHRGVHRPQGAEVPAGPQHSGGGPGKEFVNPGKKTASRGGIGVQVWVGCGQQG